MAHGPLGLVHMDVCQVDFGAHEQLYISRESEAAPPLSRARMQQPQRGPTATTHRLLVSASCASASTRTLMTPPHPCLPCLPTPLPLCSLPCALRLLEPGRCQSQGAAKGGWSSGSQGPCAFGSRACSPVRRGAIRRERGDRLGSGPGPGLGFGSRSGLDMHLRTVRVRARVRVRVRHACENG